MKVWKRQLHKENLWLLTEEEYNNLPDGTLLLSIKHEYVVKGEDYIDMDTRFGVIAYGFTPGMAESQGLMDKFAFWMLKS